MKLYIVVWVDENGNWHDDPAIHAKRDGAIEDAKRMWPDASDDDLVVYVCEPE